MAKKKSELPKSRALWRVTGLLMRMDGQKRPETSGLLVLKEAQKAMMEWRSLGVTDAEIIVDDDAVKRYREQRRNGG